RWPQLRSESFRCQSEEQLSRVVSGAPMLPRPRVLNGETIPVEVRSGDPLAPGRQPRGFDSEIEKRFARDFGRAPLAARDRRLLDRRLPGPQAGSVREHRGWPVLAPGYAASRRGQGSLRHTFASQVTMRGDPTAHSYLLAEAAPRQFSRCWRR